MSVLKVYLIAGEPSGDLLGARLMRSLRKQTNNQIEFCGVGGEAMEQEGLHSLFDIADLSVMGIWEVIPSIPKILRHINEIMTDIRQCRPDIVMTIDSYSFSERIHKRLKKEGFLVPHVHCVAPQVWAWKKGRAKKISQFVDHLFCLLPGEEDYFKPHGMATTFIGHPVIERGADKGDGQRFRRDNNLSEQTLVLSLLPGSRKNEIKYLLPIFKEAVTQLHCQHKDIFVVIPSVRTVSEKVKEALAGWEIPYLIVEGEQNRYDAFAASNAALAASGTVSLELAMAGVPHLIAYKFSKLTGYLAKKLLKIRFVNLLNLIADKQVVPELLQDDCTVDNVLKELKSLLEHPHQETQESLEKLGLGRPLSPSDKMAEVVLNLIEKAHHDRT